MLNTGAAGALPASYSIFSLTVYKGDPVIGISYSEASRSMWRVLRYGAVTLGGSGVPDWRALGPGLQLGGGHDMTLAVDPRNGAPLLALSDNLAYQHASVYRLEGSGTSAAWMRLGLQGFSLNPTYFVKLQVDSRGTPYLAAMSTKGRDGKDATIVSFFEWGGLCGGWQAGLPPETHAWEGRPWGPEASRQHSTQGSRPLHMNALPARLPAALSAPPPHVATPFPPSLTHVPPPPPCASGYPVRGCLADRCMPGETPQIFGTTGQSWGALCSGTRGLTSQLVGGGAGVLLAVHVVCVQAWGPGIRPATPLPPGPFT